MTTQEIKSLIDSKIKGVKARMLMQEAHFLLSSRR